MSRSPFCLFSILILGGCADLRMSDECKAVLDLPPPSLLMMEYDSTEASDRRINWSMSKSNPYPLSLVLDLSRDTSGFALAPFVHIAPGDRKPAWAGVTDTPQTAITFGRPRVVFSREAQMAPRARTPITLQFPVNPEGARISQSPRDGAGFLRRGSHTVAQGNFEAVDIDAALGTPIVAPIDGIVAFAHDASPDVPCDHIEHVKYGNVLMLVTDDDVTVTLGHLARGSILVQSGERVSRGDPIAQVGQSGGGGKPHIHLVAEALTADGIDSIPILFSGCGGGSNTWSPRNGPACRD